MGGDVHIGDADATKALADFRNAYAELRVRTPDPGPLLAGDLSGQTLTPAVYRSAGALAVSTT